MSDTEGMFVATTCLVQALIAKLVASKALSPSKVADVGDAEEFLAGLKPELMSADAREYARKTLQRFGKIFGGEPRRDS
jgi:hypothetical protein